MMSNRQSSSGNFLVGIENDGDKRLSVFKNYSFPDGTTVRIIDKGTFEKAIERGDEKLRATIERIMKGKENF